jgi:hypothetical protein
MGSQQVNNSLKAQRGVNSTKNSNNVANKSFTNGMAPNKQKPKLGEQLSHKNFFGEDIKGYKKGLDHSAILQENSPAHLVSLFKLIYSMLRLRALKT